MKHIRAVKFAPTLLLFDFWIVFVETFCRLCIIGGNIGQVYSTKKFLIIKIVQSKAKNVYEPLLSTYIVCTV